MTAQNLIRELDDKFLLRCIDDLDSNTIESAAPIRDLCSRIYQIPIGATTVMQIVTLSPLLAKEVARRYFEIINN